MKMKHIIFLLILFSTYSYILAQSKETIENKIFPESYVSSMKGNLDPEYMRQMFLTPEQTKAIKKSNFFWIDNLKLGFYLRPRYESRQNFDFNKNTDDYNSFTAQTTQVWFILDPSPYFALKVTIQDARLWGGSQVPEGGNVKYGLSSNAARLQTSTPIIARSSTDIREAFIMLKKSDKLPVDVQIGRQVYAYGDLKVLGPLNWLYNGFSFDGIRVMYNTKALSLHVFGTVLSEQHNAPGGILTYNGKTNGTIDDAYFTGTYNTIKVLEFANIDLYGFGIHKKWILNNNPLSTHDRSRQRDDLITGGVRITNRTEANTLPKGQIWDWTLESAWQTGYNGERVNAGWDYIGLEIEGKRVYTEKVKYDARFFSIETGILLLEKLRFGIGYTYGSGDPNRSDSKAATWNPLFPQIAGSLPYWNIMNGQSTLLSFQNTKSYSLHLNLKTESFGTFIFVIYDNQKAKLQDAWYNVTGSAIKDGSSENYSNDYSKRDKLGKRLFYQYDFTWIYNYSEYVSIWSGFSYIQAQDAIRNVRDNPNSNNPVNRYTFDPKAIYFYFLVSAAI